MEDFASLLQRDYGLKPQGKLAPMSAAAAKSNEGVSNVGSSGAMGKGKNGSTRSARASSSSSGSNDNIFSGNKPSSSNAFPPPSSSYDDVFGGPPKFVPKHSSEASAPVYDDIFRPQAAAASSSSMDYAFDAPRYDDDIFNGVPGTRVQYEDVFGGSAATSNAANSEDLLGGYRSQDHNLKSSDSFRATASSYDDLLPGFGSGPSVAEPSKSSQRAELDPFGGIAPDPFPGTSVAASDPLDPFINIGTAESNGVEIGMDGFDVFTQPMPSVGTKTGKDTGGTSPINTADPPKSVRRNFTPHKERSSQISSRSSRDESLSGSSSPPKKKEQVAAAASSFSSSSSAAAAAAASSDAVAAAAAAAADEFATSSHEQQTQEETEMWITIDDVKLLTRPSSAPPPSRPAPGFWSEGQTSQRNDLKTTEAGDYSYSDAAYFSADDQDASDLSSSAAAMKEAAERAEAKAKRVKEARERDREREREREREKEKERVKEEREREKEREKERENEEREKRERAAVERATAEARERAANDAKERAERAAVERATTEARERAGAEAKQRAVERAAVERALSESRIRAERAAVERVNAEARERAERAASERIAVERVQAAARERVANEARERIREQKRRSEADLENVFGSRAANEARERIREQQRRSEDDLENIFGSRANSAPKQRPKTQDFMSDARTSTSTSTSTSMSKNEIPRRTASGAPVRKVSSTTNMSDDWTTLFGPSPSSNEFREIDGETADRRKARWDREQRTMERAAKALQAKNQRDIDVQKEQAEKNRAGEVLDAEIRRWAAGKEGNLRALLSTLQYVLWPECGWQPVSLTDLITGSSVKKVYRKATLCVHPDKVQQKGATVQQKYIAEKVFDLLKEAWNKLNAEELF